MIINSETKLVPNNWLVKCSIGYLLLPFIIFCLTFLKIWIGLPIVVLLGWLTWRIWKQKDAGTTGAGISKRDLIIGLIVLGLWVVLSGIGGFAFQNLDFIFRNVTFRDLINFHWPVYYLGTENAPDSTPTALVYYIGYWLPSALIGKLWGWQAANASLFIWTLLGVSLTAVLLKQQIKSTLLASSALLIFFSGMDILGTLSIRSISPNVYPWAWPPITIIDWWVTGSFQFSSFTTQLFWVFNQAVPAWICIALIMQTKKPRIVFYIWGLCYFVAPMPAMGMLPFVFLVIPNKAFNSENISFKRFKQNARSFLMNCMVDIRAAITPENIFGGGAILLISSLYFSANPNSLKFSILNMNALIFLFYVIFLIYEVILLWILFFKERKNNLWWYVAGGMFMVLPLIRLSTLPDICMRASIPALFVLMVWAGEALFRKPHVKYRGALILVLLIGAITPIYEINRSIFRTGEYYFLALTNAENTPLEQSIERNSTLPEFSHPTSLTADLYPSTPYLITNDLLKSIGDTKNSFFFKYLAAPP